MTLCVYRCHLAAMGSGIHFFQRYIKIAILLNWLETFKLEPVRVA